MNARCRRPRCGSALLLILFVVAVTGSMVCLLLEAQTVEIRCAHNHVSQVAALYIAEAGRHDATTKLIADPNWRAGFTDKPFPAGLGHSYTVTVADAPEGKILVTSTGRTADGHSKTVTVTLPCL